jgi:hypothetical protein
LVSVAGPWLDERTTTSKSPAVGELGVRQVNRVLVASTTTPVASRPPNVTDTVP